MTRRALPIFAWAILGLLGLAAAILSLGQRETQPFPSADSYAPSGAAALNAMLRRQGYSVRVDQSADPAIRSGDLAILFEIYRAPTPFDGKAKHPIEDRIRNLIKSGANAIVLPLSADFATDSVTALKAGPASATLGSWELKVNAGSAPLTGAMSDTLTGYGVSAQLGELGDEDLATGVRLGSGTVVVLASGLPATNRFIDKADDAALLSSLVSALQRKGGRIVFAEATFGNVHERSLMEAIGPWANAAWQQLLFLAIVVIYTLGKRFGLPDASRMRQQGSRELAEAIAQTMLRSKDRRSALQLIYSRTDAQIRAAYRIPKDSPPLERDQHIPSSLRESLNAVESALRAEHVPDSTAVQVVDRLLRAMREEGVSKRREIPATMAP